jgi:hypothetical protein
MSALSVLRRLVAAQMLYVVLIATQIGRMTVKVFENE